MVAPAIELHEVSKRFDAVQSLDALTLSIAPGTVFGYLGPNGAGKTTTLRVLLGLVRPDRGEVKVLGHDPRKDPTRVRRQVGVLLENDGLYDRLTAWQNLDFFAKIHHLEGADRQQRCAELLRACGLYDRKDERVVTFSKGMRQKVAVARALLHRPSVVLLDEPFTGLDPVAAAALREDIVKLAKDQGTTVVLTTHDLAHVERSCDRVAVLTKGKVIAEGTIDELRGSREDMEVAVAGEGLDEETLAAMKSEGVIASFKLDGVKPAAHVFCSPDRRKQLGPELIKRGVALEELTTVRASLEEAFIALMADQDGKPR